MEYTFNNNGIEICARYSESEINEIFIPIGDKSILHRTLQKLTARKS